jgi:hypothetical protein
MGLVNKPLVALDMIDLLFVRYQCSRTSVLSCHRYLINNGTEKMNKI